MNYRKIILFAAIFGGTSVILGAFGAHALKEILEETQITSFKTGVSYQFNHSLLLIGIGIMYKLRESNLLKYAAICCIIGMLFFSGSLYVLSCKEIIGLNNIAFIGPITPIGGLLLVLAWVFVAVNFAKKEIV